VAAARVEEAEGSCPMLDVIMLVTGIGFFALSIAYAVVCGRL
jgi:hypothetical protein